MEVSTTRKKVSASSIASFALLALAVLYWLIALGNVFLGRVDSQEISRGNAPRWYWAAAWNFAVAALCFAARQMMQKGTQVLSAGAVLLLCAALLMTIRTWVAGQLSGRNHYPWIEVLVIWPALLYATAIAFKQSRRQKQPPQSIPPQ